MRFLKFLLKVFVVGGVLFVFAFSIGLNVFYFSGKYAVPIMMYHHVTTEANEAEDVTPENFRKQMNYLKKNHYHVIRLDELVEKIKSGKPLAKKTVVIAFDDGNEDNYTQAFPILKEFQFPAIFFVSPDFMNRDGFMTWEQVKEIKDANFDIGSHGMTQAYLPDLSRQELKYEIMESKRILEEELNVPINYIAYPVGGFTDEVKALAKKAGYKAGLTTNRGYDRFDKDVYELNRVRFSNADNADIILRVKLSGYYNRFRDLKKPY